MFTLPGLNCAVEEMTTITFHCFKVRISSRVKTRAEKKKTWDDPELTGAAAKHQSSINARHHIFMNHVSSD